MQTKTDNNNQEGKSNHIEWRLIKSKYTDETREDQFAHIIERLSKGETLERILDSDPQLPGTYTFFKWLKTPEYAQVYAYAREVRAAKLFDECLAIADGQRDDDTVVKVQRDRLRVDTIKFYLSKIVPKLYGDRVDITSNGESINILSLGSGIAPPTDQGVADSTQYIDVTEGNDVD